jgi:hypothetical protein
LSIPPPQPPWVQPPEGSQNIIPGAAIALPIVGAGETLVLSYISPAGWDSYLDKIRLQFLGQGFQDYSGDLIWRVLVDGRPVSPDFNATLTQLGSGQIFLELKCPIRVKSQQILTGTIIHAGNIGLNGNVVVAFAGYRSPNLNAN